jgi:mRNA-degrading endonuclease RelE of RelBE toxin-antitoxin system
MDTEPPEFEQEELESQPSVTIDLTPEFYRNLRDLNKRYRHVRADIQTIIQDLDVGNFVGDRISGIGEDYVMFKVRVKNRDIQKGKSAGYRLIYQVESPTCILLLTIYSKSDRSDITAGELRSIAAEFQDNDDFQ